MALAYALARAGNIAEAVAVARALARPAEVLLHIGSEAARQGKQDQARALLRELNKGDNFRGAWPDLNGDSMRLGIARLDKELGNPAPYKAAVVELERRVAEPEAPLPAVLQLFGLYVTEGNMDGARRLAPAIRTACWRG
jgi:hypothetical protein